MWSPTLVVLRHSLRCGAAATRYRQASVKKSGQVEIHLKRIRLGFRVQVLVWSGLAGLGFVKLD